MGRNWKLRGMEGRGIPARRIGGDSGVGLGVGMGRELGAGSGVRWNRMRGCRLRGRSQKFLCRISLILMWV